MQKGWLGKGKAGRLSGPAVTEIRALRTRSSATHGAICCAPVWPGSCCSAGHATTSCSH